MPTTIQTLAYSFAELSDSAKETARDKYRQYVYSDPSDWEYVFDDASTIAAILGISIADPKGRHSRPAIYFSGFSSQGDGASFEGQYHYAKGAAKAIRAYAPQDTRLHAIADELQDLQRKRFFRLSADIFLPGRYCHSGCMHVDVSDDGEGARVQDEDAITQCMRDFADWIYSQIQADYEYQCSAEAIDDLIEANERLFDEDGNPL